uniref:Uncharacterized protein n=1 Tax=Xenopus tropicalis TaxID=8364 RepID=A0A1B8XZG6_XENTR
MGKNSWKGSAHKQEVEQIGELDGEEQQEGFSPQAGNRADMRVGYGKNSWKGSAHKQEVEQIGELDGEEQQEGFSPQAGNRADRRVGWGRTAGRVQPTSRK